MLEISYLPNYSFFDLKPQNGYTYIFCFFDGYIFSDSYH